jgi:two-component system response regulator AlgR
MKILIVDDEAPARRRLRELLSDVAGDVPHSVAGEAVNGVEALALAQDLRPDLIFADMQMPRMGGLELARHLLKMEEPPAVIFVTAHDEFALEAFEVHALDYLMKPVRAERLLASLMQAGVRLAARSAPSEAALAAASSDARRHFSISERGRIMLVPVEDVIYLRAELKYVTVHTLGRDYLLEESLTKLEEEFDKRFVRIHRNALVAVDRITGFEKGALPDAEGEAGVQWLVVLKDCGEKLPVSRRQWGAVKELARG